MMKDLKSSPAEVAGRDLAQVLAGAGDLVSAGATGTACACSWSDGRVEATTTPVEREVKAGGLSGVRNSHGCRLVAMGGETWAVAGDAEINTAKLNASTPLP